MTFLDLYTDEPGHAVCEVHRKRLKCAILEMEDAAARVEGSEWCVRMMGAFITTPPLRNRFAPTMHLLPAIPWQPKRYGAALSWWRRLLLKWALR